MNVFDSFAFDSFYADESDDMMYLHILDCIGALSRIQKRSGKMYLKTENRNKYNPLAESKRRIFWQAVRELADQEILLANKKDKNSSEINSAQSRVLNVFPDEAKRLDGRSWLPLHWAVSLPNTDKLDIENWIIARPEAVKICISSSSCNPIYGERQSGSAQIYFPLWGESLDPLITGSTLAAWPWFKS